jgi:hypothetical protein
MTAELIGYLDIIGTWISVCSYQKSPRLRAFRFPCGHYADIFRPQSLWSYRNAGEGVPTKADAATISEF